MEADSTEDRGNGIEVGEFPLVLENRGIQEVGSVVKKLNDPWPIDDAEGNPDIINNDMDDTTIPFTIRVRRKPHPENTHVLFVGVQWSVVSIVYF